MSNTFVWDRSIIHGNPKHITVDMDQTLPLLKINLQRKQNKLTQLVLRQRWEVNFDIRQLILVKLQPYKPTNN